jgi:hypothetical protein
MYSVVKQNKACQVELVETDDSKSIPINRLRQAQADILSLFIVRKI